MRKILLTILVTILSAPIFAWSAESGLRIMSYNVANLFDAQHDEGKFDGEYLPRRSSQKEAACANETTEFYKKRCLASDWTDQKVEMKLKQIQKVIQFAGNPAIIGLTEVENENVLRRLAAVAGYNRWLITNSGDVRGIDVAFLIKENSRLRFIDSREIRVDGTKKLTRNILEASFMVGTAPLTVYVNHWPSQAAPASERMLVANILKQAINKKLSQSANTHIIALGDFNVIPADRPDPFYNVLQNSQAGIPLYEIDALFRSTAAKEGVSLDAFPKGTYFYWVDMQWNTLDRFFVSPNLLDNSGLNIDLSSYRILSAPQLTGVSQYGKSHYLAGTVIRGVPGRFNANTTDPNQMGYSDHFPIVINLK